MTYTFLDNRAPEWAAQVDALCGWLGAPNNPALFPLQFLKATFPAIGGKIVVAGEVARPEAVGFLFPRDVYGGRRVYTLRVEAAESELVARVVREAEESLAADVVLYDPQGPHRYAATHHDMGTCDLGAPDGDEAAQIPLLQQQIWGAGAGFLYPADLHSPDFRPGSSLVARADGRIAGVLFGFYRFGGSEQAIWWGDHRADLRIESQILGVDPQFRRLGLGFLLKRRQRELALQERIDIIHWTVDPLQFPNALLNFTRLGAVAFDFYPDYYPFRNALNQLPASRFRLTWLLRAPSVARRVAFGGKGRPADLDAFPGALVLTEGSALDGPTDAPFVAVEIPGDWTTLQQNDLDRARRWRAATDTTFSALVGIGPGRYVITDTVSADERRFLIARPCEDGALLFADEENDRPRTLGGA